jgi:hypothetical protein
MEKKIDLEKKKSFDLEKKKFWFSAKTDFRSSEIRSTSRRNYHKCLNLLSFVSIVEFAKEFLFVFRHVIEK